MDAFQNIAYKQKIFTALASKYLQTLLEMPIMYIPD